MDGTWAITRCAFEHLGSEWRVGVRQIEVAEELWRRLVGCRRRLRRAVVGVRWAVRTSPGFSWVSFFRDARNPKSVDGTAVPPGTRSGIGRQTVTARSAYPPVRPAIAGRGAAGGCRGTAGVPLRVRAALADAHAALARRMSRSAVWREASEPQRDGDSPALARQQRRDGQASCGTGWVIDDALFLDPGVHSGAYHGASAAK